MHDPLPLVMCPPNPNLAEQGFIYEVGGRGAGLPIVPKGWGEGEGGRTIIIGVYVMKGGGKERIELGYNTYTWRVACVCV